MKFDTLHDFFNFVLSKNISQNDSFHLQAGLK